MCILFFDVVYMFASPLSNFLAKKLDYSSEKRDKVDSEVDKSHDYHCPANVILDLCISHKFH